jgi:hypothetical protein
MPPGTHTGPAPSRRALPPARDGFLPLAETAMTLPRLGYSNHGLGLGLRTVHFSYIL